MSVHGLQTAQDIDDLRDVRLYKRTLTPAEVALLASGFRGPLGGEIGWWLADNRGIRWRLWRWSKTFTEWLEAGL